MKKCLLTHISLLICMLPVFGQYGNEWIDFEKTYYKFQVSEDGIYRIPQSVLADTEMGVVPAAQFRLYRLGVQVPIYTTSAGVLGGGDFIEFYGQKNRGEADRTLFQQPDAEQLNQEYSMFSDASTYFLTWESTGQGARLMQTPNDLSNPPAAEPYYMRTDEWVYSDHAVDPRLNSDGISYSRFSEAEGFGRSEINSFLLDCQASMAVTNGPDARMQVRLASSSVSPHRIQVVFAEDTILENGSALNFHLYQLSKTLPAASVGASQVLDIKDLDPLGRFAVATIQWTYARSFDFTGRNSEAFRHAGSGVAQYFELGNFDHGGSDPVVYDRTGGMRLVAQRNGSTVRFLLPAYTGERSILVTSQATGIKEISSLTKRTFTNYSGDNTEYIIITHPSLRAGSDVVASYAEYRSSVAGGEYQAHVYNIDDLTDQFGYGIANHPQAIRNFNTMIQDNWANVRTVLIIGKGIVYTQSRKTTSSGAAKLLVPTFGNPGSDNLLFTRNGFSQPPFPIGRLPVSSTEQLLIYLSKVKEYDATGSLPQTIADRAWTKHILHLGGGEDASQQAQILNFLNIMGNSAINGEYGANVSTFTKTSTNPTGQSNSELILDILKSGTSVVKFFGHSSASTLDFQINNPSDWQNKGKYPIFSAMGCRAGDIHQGFLSLSENFVFAPDAGTIAFVAGSGSQYQNTLGNWGREWYNSFGNNSSTLTLGETVRQSLATLNQFSSYQSVVLIEQQTINGDPAIRFHPVPGPDYVWDYKSVSFSPEIVTTNETSFSLSGDIVNIGTNVPDSARVVVRQKFADGHIEAVYSGIVHVSGFRTHLEFPLPIKRTASGPNTFYLDFDTEHTIEELPDPAAEANNSLVSEQGVEGINLFILDNRALASYPIEFSIVTEGIPTLIASSTNAFIKGQNFVMEIDTTAEFNSPLKLREHFSEFGGTIRWKPFLQYVPGTVYYWRVSTESSSPNPEYIWDASSFLYQPGGERGWNQSHYYQFLRDEYDDMEVSTQRNFVFTEGLQNVWVQNAVDTGEIERFKFFINNNNFISFYRPWRPFDAHVFVAVFDPVTGEQMKNPIGGAFGAINPFDRQRPVFPFNTANPESRNALMTFLEDEIPSGHYVVLFTYQREGFLDYHADEWALDSVTYGRNLFSVIENIYPESGIRTLENGSIPYTLFFQKDVAAIQEQVALDYDATISVEANFPLINTSGNTYSTLVGPASKWSRVEWDFTQMEAHDTLSLTVYAVRGDKSEVVVTDQSIEPTIDLTGWSANDYPYMRIEFHAADTSAARTAPQLKYWRVLYEGRPEFVYNPSGGFEFHYDTLPQGQILHFSTIVENISPYDADAFTVKYSVSDAANNSFEVEDIVPALASGASAMISFSEPIKDHAGNHIFLSELNPGETLPELHHYNNFGLRQFYVVSDQQNPLLDVTFDGRHLLDGDVVASHPEIIITLLDGNAFLPIDDREHFELFIETPQAFELEKVSLSGDDITFLPSDPTNGLAKATLIWHPEFLEDGYYTFRANASDASDNKPTVPYEVFFEVLGQPRIVDLKVIPNPFSDQVRFSFTLTGHTPAQSLILRITDVAGRTVRTLNPGNVFVGTHHMDVIWDGRSDGGSLVPGGMYFYRIEATGADGQQYLFDRANGDTGKILYLR